MHTSSIYIPSVRSSHKSYGSSIKAWQGNHFLATTLLIWKLEMNFSGPLAISLMIRKRHEKQVGCLRLREMGTEGLMVSRTPHLFTILDWTLQPGLKQWWRAEPSVVFPVISSVLEQHLATGRCPVKLLYQEEQARSELSWLWGSGASHGPSSHITAPPCSQL